MNRKTVKEILQFGFDETRALPTYEKVKEREREWKMHSSRGALNSLHQLFCTTPPTKGE